MTKNVFFICGLPRSRTAWMANLMTFGDCVCLHDFWKVVSTPEEMAAELEGIDAASVGLSDPLSVSFQDGLIGKFPSAKWLIIERDFHEVEKSCAKSAPDKDLSILHYLNGKIEELRGKLPADQIRTVRFEDLSSFMEMRDICDWLSPGFTGMNGPRWDLLTSLNVQVCPEIAKLEEESGKDHGKLLSARMEANELSPATVDYLSAVKAICQNHEGAWTWFLSVLDAAMVWDHIVDRDPVDPAMAERVFTSLTTEWPLNPFLFKFAPQLLPVMVNARSAWRHSNKISSPKGRAYDIYTEVPATIAWLAGGNSMVDEVMPEVRDLVGKILIEDETRDRSKK